MPRSPIFGLTLLLLASAASASQPRSLPLVFEENVGQAASSIRYLARGSNANFFFATNRITISPRHASAPLLLSFPETSAPEIIGEDPEPGTSNYLVGHDASEWRTGIRHFRKVRYRNFSPGIDAVFYSSDQQLEFDFILQPSADISQLSFQIHGASAMKLRDGDLVMRIGGSELRLRKPFTYQIIDGKKHSIATQYHLAGNQISFAVGPHTKEVPLIIDPVLDYASYLGGSGAEWAYSIAADNSGAIYVTGVTQSSNFPVSAALQRNNAGGLGDIFVTKLGANGSLQYSTYIGGSGSEGDTQGYVGGITVDLSGNAYVTGVTRSADFPTTPGAFQPAFATHDTCGNGPSGGPCGDAFLLKLNPAGTALVYSSFLGGSNHDEAKALAIDNSGNVYVTGITSSSDFPTTSNAFGRVLQYQDAFISKISADGAHLLYSTLLGGSGYDLSLAIAVDPQGRAHVAGMTESADFPVRHALDSELDPPWDAFITLLTPEGNDLEFSTLLGGNGTQQVLGIALDTIGDIYLAGYTDSADFPIVNAFQPDYGGGGGNGFATKLKSDGRAIVYSTFFGGQDAISELDAIFVNDRGEAYVAGSGGSDFPTVTSTRNYAGAADAVLAKLTPDGSGVYYSSFFGGNGYDLASGLAHDSNGNLWIAGETTSTSLPTHWAAPQRIFGGISDAFIARFSDAIADAPILSAPKIINVGTAYVNQPSPAKTLRISNTGSRTLHVSNVATSSNVSANTTCAAVMPGSACTLTAAITPSSVAPGIGTITLYDDSPDSPQTFTVRATGAFGGDLEVVSLSAGTPSQSYGNITVPFTALVRNNGPYDSDSITLRVSNNIGGSECTPCSIGTLAAGTSTTLRFNRVATSVGMLPVSVTVAAGSRSPDINPANDTKSVAVAIPIYTATTRAIDFAAQPVNSIGTTRRIVFNGLGYGPFQLSFSLSGDFIQTNTCGTSNDDGCYIDLAFRPTATGLRSGSLTVNESVAGTTETITLAGNGVLAPFLTLSATALDFGIRMVGRASNARKLTLTNTGSAALQIVSISSTPEFTVSHDCATSLAPSYGCEVNLVFTPLSTGPRSGNLTIQDNAVASPHAIALVGAGTTAPILIAPLSVDFGPQRLGVSSSPQIISLTNVGGTTIRLGSVWTPPGFQQTNNCTSIEPDGSCQMNVFFTASVSGTVGGTLTIQDDGFGSPRSISLSGTGVQPAFSIDRNSLTFPSTRVNAASPTQFVTVTNTGNTSMLLQNIAADGDFSVTNGCGAVVPANVSCFLVVVFRPSATGTRSGEIIINDDAPGSPHRVTLTGTGRALLLNLSPASITYATQAVGTSSPPQTIVVTNDTNAVVNVFSIVTAGDYSQTNTCPQQLAPDATCFIDILFSPKAAGTRVGSLTFTDSSGSHGVALSGAGAASAASVSLSSIVFPPTLIGGASTQNISISSIGTAPLTIAAPTITGVGFRYLSSCPNSLATGRTCTISIHFTPSSLGLAQGSLQWIDDAPGSPRVVALSGTGLQVSINPERPQRHDRNLPSFTAIPLRSAKQGVTSAAAVRSAGTVLGTFSASADLAFKNHARPNSAGSSSAPNQLPGKPLSRNLDSLCGTAAADDRRRLASGHAELFLSSDQDVAALHADVSPTLVGNDIEAGRTLVHGLDFEAARLKLEAGSSCDRNLAADQLGEVTVVPNSTQPEHAKRSPRQ